MCVDLLKNGNPDGGCGSADRVFCGQEPAAVTPQKPVEESDEQRIARKIAALFKCKPLWG
jgi:hypothetical protein